MFTVAPTVKSALLPPEITPLTMPKPVPRAPMVALPDESAARFTALQAEIIGEIDAAMDSHRRAVEQIQSIRATQEADDQRGEALAAQVQAGAADPLDLTVLKLEQNTRWVLEEEAESRAEQALGRLEAALQQVLGTYTWLVAPAPPDHFERNPREEKEQR